MIIFDLETDGLLNDVTQIHCICIYDTETDQTVAYNDRGVEEPVVRAIQRLEDADTVVGHNIIGYDIPVICKLFPWFKTPDHLVDTLLLSRLIHTDLLAKDYSKGKNNIPLQLCGRHSLEAYGYRLGTYKGQFSKTTDWKEWSQDMQDYCIQDVNVTKELCNHFLPYLNGSL